MRVYNNLFRNARLRKSVSDTTRGTIFVFTYNIGKQLLTFSGTNVLAPVFGLLSEPQSQQ